MTTPTITSYDTFLSDLKTRIRAARTRAALAVNRELILLYWQIGRDILERQEREGWGAKVVERLATDLRVEFPDMKGFSPRNLLFMRSFAEVFADEEKVKQLVSQLPWGHIVRLMRNTVKPAIPGTSWSPDHARKQNQ
jgi:predicted nuclease of restriction endonuclease-like (RecB) superfamily